jgi:hypothetical protein
MAYNYSYNTLIDRFKAFADGHYLIRKFTHGQIDLADLDLDGEYPYMHVAPGNITPVQGAMQFGFEVLFMDLPRDKETKAEYQRESLSDCIRLAQDLITEIAVGRTLFGVESGLATQPTIQPLIEEYKHTLTGVQLSISIELPYDWSACDIPADYSVGGSGSGGSGVALGITFKVNGVDNAIQNVLDLVEGTGINITDNGDGSVTISNTGGGGSISWGDIVGTLSNQTDLQDALNDKADTASLAAVATSGDYDDLDNLPTIPDITGLVPYTGATNDVAIGNHNLTADDGSFNSAMQPNLFGVENAAATIYSTLEYNALNVVDSTTGDAMQVNASEIVFPDATTQSTAAIPQIQSDWNQSNNAAVDFIKNKPTIGSGTVTSVGTTGLISGGTITTSGTITTQMATNRLVGRATAGSGIMEEITIGSGLTLTGAGVLNNTATPTPTGYYGAFQDNTTQTAASINTAYAVKFNTTDLSNGVTVVNDGSSNPTRITLANTGIYNIQFSLQLEKTGGSGNMIADIWIRKNGVDVPSTTGKIVLTGSANASPVVAAWNYVLDLVAGDYVQLMWSTTNTNVEIVAAGSTTPHPSIPSSILTVTQQAGILAGTGITAINSLTGAAQTIGVGTSGTDFAISSSGTAHTLNLPTASASNRGALSSTDWSTFNAKQAALVSGTNIKTVNSTSLLGSGNVAVAAQDSISLINNVAVTIGTSTTSYVSFCAFTTNSAEASRQIIIPISGTIRNLYVLTSSTQSANNSQVCTVRKNGANTAVTVTIAASAAAGTFSDTTNTVSVAAGDRLALQVQNNAASGTAAQIVSVAIIIERS